MPPVSCVSVEVLPRIISYLALFKCVDMIPFLCALGNTCSITEPVLSCPCSSPARLDRGTVDRLLLLHPSVFQVQPTIVFKASSMAPDESNPSEKNREKEKNGGRQTALSCTPPPPHLHSSLHPFAVFHSSKRAIQGCVRTSGEGSNFFWWQRARRS